MTDATFPVLDATEARVLGCLVEKEAATAAPLTESATLQAVNQKTSREPVMELDPGEVGRALRSLENKGLARRVDGARALRFQHTALRTLELTRGQLAALALLLLRGPQTAAELLARSERLHRYAHADDLAQTLERLSQRGLAVALARTPGQREGRWAHLLSGPVKLDQAARIPDDGGQERKGSATTDRQELAERLAELEQRVAALEARNRD